MAKLFALYLLAVVGLEVVRAAPLELRQPNKAQCAAGQKKVAADLQQMGDVINQLAAQMNLGNATVDASDPALLAANGTAACEPAQNATAGACELKVAGMVAKAKGKGKNGAGKKGAKDKGEGEDVDEVAEEDEVADPDLSVDVAANVNSTAVDNSTAIDNYCYRQPSITHQRYDG
ncbi:hypothetical protein EDB89DRAFT_381186 [Lactarius sanguifluus]|nr:hypothetical protein EDB89DRAFT_381186 [Lactarius sanguifluus]